MNLNIKPESPLREGLSFFYALPAIHGETPVTVDTPAPTSLSARAPAQGFNRLANSRRTREGLFLFVRIRAILSLTA